MVSIEVHISRPFQTLCLMVAVVAGIAWWNAGAPLPAGGSGAITAQVVADAEKEARTLRIEQEVLKRREEILRYQLHLLEQERLKAVYADDDDLRERIRQATEQLLFVLKDQKRGEQELLASLQQLWDARGYAAQVTRGSHPGDIALEWPVEPLLGISAYFEDEGYRLRFGMEHHAIDIPVEQGSPVASAADGVVVRAEDKGMGFNAIVIQHPGGYATLYGHVNEILVRQGDRVRAGDVIGRSGGIPGTPGAGLISTGPHVHFELHVDGAEVDPLPHMVDHPALPG